ncbi:hypothetical protein KVR01_002955 [Diaporthe batatas]|uniref:uncharacterized protein n=1 Tax=Diaporthe batatas TaxID=748121 RepID=UPI001D0422B4|nr:uncharacterized protein KVR01_002955 [Diaporthe batatas]KAG8167266.1 hypothetical protein KVR01_002955 [Diaporthe batatas]
MVSYRIITVLALAAAGVIAAPCDAGNGAAATGVANAQGAQATGAAGNAQATGGAGNAQGGNAGGAGGNAGGAAAAGGNDAACNPANVADGQGPANVGVDGAQFVTGICTSDANCASGCCVLGGGKNPDVAVCRNEPALQAGESCGFSCAA